MSSPIRVVIADDSPFMVRTLMLHLKSDPGFEVVGTALNGPRAVELVRKLRPDVLTLDVDMPGWNHESAQDSSSMGEDAGDAGLQALEQIMKKSPVPVVMVSGVSHSAAATTLRAIEAGATDFVLKYTPGVDTDPEIFRRDLLVRLRSAATSRGVATGCASLNGTLTVPITSLPATSLPATRLTSTRHTSTRLSAGVTTSARSSHGSSPGGNHGNPTAETATTARPMMGGHSAIDHLYEKMQQATARAGSTSEMVHSSVRRLTTASGNCLRLIVVGASTGGPTALKELLAELPGDFPVPIVVVQHMPAAFTGVLAAQLDRRVALRVREAWPGDILKSGSVFIAPGERHLLVTSELSIELSDSHPVCGHRPSVNVTMNSAADVFGDQVAGVLLTGMGEDGADGMLNIHRAGGVTFAQRGETCVVNGMPQRAIDRGAVQMIDSPDGIGRSLQEFVMSGVVPDSQSILQAPGPLLV